MSRAVVRTLALLISVPFLEQNIRSKHVVNAVTVSINISGNAKKLAILI